MMKGIFTVNLMTGSKIPNDFILIIDLYSSSTLSGGIDTITLEPKSNNQN